MSLIMSSFKWERDEEDQMASSQLSQVSHNPNATLLNYLSSGVVATNSISLAGHNGNETVSDCYGCENGTQNYSLSTINSYSPTEGELFEVPVSIIVLLSILYGGISIAALIGNLSVLWIVAISRRMRTVTNMFIANLALADIIIGLFTIPFQFQAALLQRWNLPDFMCALCPFVQVLSVNISVFTLSAIAVDRYRAVLFPLKARVSKRKAMWVIISIWSVGLILALPTELDYEVIFIQDKGMTKPFCANVGLDDTFRKYYVLGLVVIQYFSPLIIISGAYAHMATKLWGTTAPGNKEESRDAIVLRNKKKVIKMLSIVVLLFALCWLPLQMYNFLQTLIPSINEYQYINIIWFVSHWLAMSNSCVNPFIYAVFNDKFQREFRTRMCCFRYFCPKKTEDTINVSDGSDYDRTKVRASYRGNKNLSVRYNHQSVYNHTGSPRYQTTEFRRNNTNTHRNSSTNSNGKTFLHPLHNNHHQQQHQITRPDHLHRCGEGVSPETRKCNGNNNDVGYTSICMESPMTPSPGTPKAMAVIAVECGGSHGRQCINVSKTLTVVATASNCKL